MTTDDFSVFLDFLENNTANNIIDSSGFSKHKKQIYNAILSLDKNQSIQLDSNEAALKKILSKLDIKTVKSLQNAMLTSYYTPEYIVNAISNSLAKYSIKAFSNPVSILEPSAGSGNFINKLSAALPNSSITGIEKDKLTYNLLENNVRFFDNKNVNIIHKPYEEYSIQNTFDFIISNIPFGNYGVHDKQINSGFYSLYKNQIHNFFFVKALHQIKPGGIISFITTHSFSDNKNTEALRKKLMDEFNLVSLFRFDNKTFSDSKTSVVSDLIILQKPLEIKNHLTSKEEHFIETSIIEIDKKNFNVNNFFLYNAEYIFGNLSVTSNAFGGSSLTVSRFPDFNKKLFEDSLTKNISKNLNSYGIPLVDNVIDSSVNINLETEKEAELKHNAILDSYPYAIPGNIIISDNKAFVCKPNSNYFQYLTSSLLELKPNDLQFFKDLIPIRETYKAMLAYQRSNDLASFLIKQKDLNLQYDQFNFYYGPFNIKRNRNLILKDADFDLISSLEKTIDASKNIYDKTDIFSIDTFEVAKTEQIDTIDKALIASFNKYGAIELDYISSVLNIDSIDWISKSLNDKKIFINPIFNDSRVVVDLELVLKSRFLSGYVNEKIQFFNKPNLQLNNPLTRFLNKNIVDISKFSLINAKPIPLNLKDINPALGEPWIIDSVFTQFANEHFKSNNFSIRFFEAINKYKIKGPYTSFASDTYGVSSKYKTIPFLKIFQYALEHNIPSFKKEIYNRKGDLIKVIDKDLLTAIQLKIDKLNDAFYNWINTNPTIKEYIVNTYNYKFNSFVKESFDATQFDFNVKDINPYAHQKNGAWQLITNNGGILDHKVGFGKTLTMAMSIAKRIELGITSKELVVGLNANYLAIYDDIKSYYPNKKMLLVKPSDLTKDKQNATFYNIANTDYDIIVVPHSSLLKFPKSPHASAKIYKDLLDEAYAIHSDKDLKAADLRILDKKIENLKAKYEYFNGIIDNYKTHNFILFEDLKIDHITIDESQYFKNLSFSTTHSRVKGLGSQKDVQKTANLLSYIRSIQLKHGADKGVTFSTGTTISNSLVELYTLFKYLSPNLLISQGINSFDQWAKVFCRKSQDYEETVSGEIKLTERFRHFVKVPELAKMYSSLTHFADDTTFKIEKPELVNNLISIDAYIEQSLYFDSIKEFGKTKDTTKLIGVEDSFNNRKAAGLICTSHGRKASLDMRLISPMYGDHPNSKINVMIRKSLIYYKKFNEDKGTQLIFCDSGTPTSKGFKLYHAIKDNLIKEGIPENEIAFIHNYKKKDPDFIKINNGEIRYLIGSTQKMGVGVNVQQKLVALHHLDFPWRPTDLEQRNGRGDRQGNLLLPKFDNKINSFYYAKKGSIDAYTFNILQIKQHFINQIKNDSIVSRTLDEGNLSDDGNLSFEHYMAACSNNVDFTEKLKLEKKYLSFQNKLDAHNKNKHASTHKLNIISDNIISRTKRIEKLDQDHKIYSNASSKSFFPFILNNTTFKDSPSLGLFLQNKIDTAIRKQNAIELGSFYTNFKIVMEYKYVDFPLAKDNYKIFVKCPSNYKIGFKNNIIVKDKKDAGNYIFNALEKIPTIISNQEKLLNDEIEQKENLTKIINEPFKELEAMKNAKKEIQMLENKINKENKKNNPDKDKGKNNGMKK